MVLDIVQTMLLLVCVGFIFYRLMEKQPANSVNPDDETEDLSEPDIEEIQETLKVHIERESNTLKLDDFGGPEFICYSCGYGHFKIWLVIWIGPNLDITATNLMMGQEYLETFERLKENRHKIEWLFPEEETIYT